MRARNIKPGGYKNEDLASCSPMARLLFFGLPMMCDREGIMEFRPARIRAELFPYDTCTVQDLCDELLRFGDNFIQIYEVDGSKYLSVTNFSKHQHPHCKEPSSELPKPPILTKKHGASTVQEPCENGSGTSQNRLIPDSGLLKAESPIPDVSELNQDKPIRRPGYADEGGTANQTILPPALAFDDFRAVWSAWLEYCREKGNTSTPIQSRLALNMLEGWGRDRAISAINHTMAMGYKGICEPKQQQSAAGKQTREDRVREMLKGGQS